MDVYDEIDTFSLDDKDITLSTTKLGLGQFGEVWKGQLKKNKRTLVVAVKIVKGEYYNDLYNGRVVGLKTFHILIKYKALILWQQ